MRILCASGAEIRDLLFEAKDYNYVITIAG
jgi:hypothetical protein